MKLRQYVITALLISIGFVLHAIVPAIFGMKFDTVLAFMMLAILLHPNKQNVLIAGLLAGIVTAMTSTFPGGQIANLVDKPVTAFSVYLMILLFAGIRSHTVKHVLIGIIGTVISGSIFLLTARVIIGLPAPFPALFVSVVLPTALLTGPFLVAIAKAAQTAMRSLAPSR